MPSARAVPLVASANRVGLPAFLRQTLAVAEAELRKLRHDPMELLTRAVQPTLWLLIFGHVFARVRDIPTGGLRYLDFLAPGILAQSVLFIAMFYGISVIWERDLGILHKYLVSPTSRVALVLGKALSAGGRGLSQAALVYLLALLIGIDVRLSPGAVAGVVIFVVLGAAVFASLSLAVACLMKTRERFMGMGQVLTMPLFFASNAIYPVALMPPWLQVIAALNPLTYEVDALRGLMIRGGESLYGLGLDFTVSLVMLVVLVVVVAKLYPRIVL
jgi:ABC-2 type transport system permease protein